MKTLTTIGTIAILTLAACDNGTAPIPSPELTVLVKRMEAEAQLTVDVKPTGLEALKSDDVMVRYDVTIGAANYNGKTTVPAIWRILQCGPESGAPLFAASYHFTYPADRGAEPVDEVSGTIRCG